MSRKCYLCKDLLIFGHYEKYCSKLAHKKCIINNSKLKCYICIKPIKPYFKATKLKCNHTVHTRCYNLMKEEYKRSNKSYLNRCGLCREIIIQGEGEKSNVPDIQIDYFFLGGF